MMNCVGLFVLFQFSVVCFLDKDDKDGPDYEKYLKAKSAFPMQISEADPSDAN